MKAQTRVDYAARVDRVLSWLERYESDVEPNLSELAAVAALSPFHFARVFRLMTGETVGDALRRIRLARAMPHALAPEITITEASMIAGYATSQAFARALRAATNLSASEARRDDGARDALMAALLNAPRSTGTPLAIEIVSVEPLRLLAVRNVGAYAELNHGFERLFERVFASVPMAALRGVHGIPHGDPRFELPERFIFDCAVDVGEEAAPSNVDVLITSGGRYLKVRHVGDYEQLLTAIDRVYSIAILQGEMFADAPLRLHYVDTPDEVPAHSLRTDILLPLEAVE